MSFGIIQVRQRSIQIDEIHMQPTSNESKYESTMPQRTLQAEQQTEPELASTERAAALLAKFPIHVLLRIFSHLPSTRLLHAAATCRWIRVVAGSDEIWRVRLTEEIPSWPSITRSTMPHELSMRTYIAASPFLPHRECWGTADAPECAPASPQRGANPLEQPSRVSAPPATTVGRAMRLLTGANKARRMAVFGAGLEASGRGLLGALLWSPGSPFNVEGMEPGHAGTLHAVAYCCMLSCTVAYCCMMSRTYRCELLLIVA